MWSKKWPDLAHMKSNLTEHQKNTDNYEKLKIPAQMKGAFAGHF